MYLLPIDRHSPMDDELSGLTSAASKHGPENCDIQTSFQGRKGHLRIGSPRRGTCR